MLIDLYNIKRFFFSRKATVMFYMRETKCDNKNNASEWNYVVIDSCNEMNYYSKKYNFLIKGEYLERLKRGSMLFMALIDGKWASYGWMAKGDEFWVSEIDWIVDLGNSKSVVLYDFYTRSEYRGNGIYPWLLNAICNDLKRESYIIFSYKFNLSSRKGIEKAYFHYCGEFRHKDKEQLNNFLSKYNIKIVGYKFHLLDMLTDRVKRE